MAEQSTKDRQDYLFLVVDNLIRERESWALDNNVPGVPTGGPLWMAAEYVVEAYETGMIPASCRQLLRSVEEFSRHWKDHAVRAEVSPTPDLTPSNNVWAAIDSIAASRKGANPAAVKMLEPLREVISLQGVTDENIAKIYDLKDNYGRLDVSQVRAGKADPEAFDKMIADRQMKRHEVSQHGDMQRAKELREKIAGKAAPQPPVSHESIEQLLQQGLTLQQVSTNKQIPIENVVTFCMQNEIVLTGSSPNCTIAPVETPNTPEPPAAREPYSEPYDPSPTGFDDLLGELSGNETEQETVTSTMPVEQQIINAADNDPALKNGEIAKLLGVSSQKVTSVLNRRGEVESVV